MRKLFSTVVAAVAAFVCGGVFGAAPLPLAVWEGNFTGAGDAAGIGEGVKLKANGNTIAEDGSAITIDADATSGITIGDFPSGTSAFTVIFEYAGLDVGATTSQTLLTARNNANANRIGAYLKADEGNKVCGIAGNNNEASPVSNGTAGSAPAASGVIALTHNSASGTYVYQKGDTVATLHGNGGLKYSGNNYDSVSIGSMVNSATFGRANGLEITRVAVYTVALTSAEISDYRWPSELTTYTGTVTGDGVVWNPALPGSLGASDYLAYVGSGTAELPSGHTACHGVSVSENVTVTGAVLNYTGYEGAGTVDYSWTETRAQVPFNDTATSYIVGVSAAVAGDEVEFKGGSSASPTRHRFNDGFELTATNRFMTGNNSGAYNIIDQYAGSVVKATGTGADDVTGTAPMIFGHWSNAQVHYTLHGGVLALEPSDGSAKRVMFGRDGSIFLTVGTGEGEALFKAPGIWAAERNRACALEVGVGGTVLMGSSGVDLVAEKPVTLKGGVLANFAENAISVNTAITLLADTVSIVSNDYAMVVNGTISGTGTLVKRGDACLTLKANRPKLKIEQGSVGLTATSAEVADGRLRLDMADEEAGNYSEDKFAVVDALGNAIEIRGISLTDGVLTLTLDTIPAITETKSISELGLGADVSGALVINGAETAGDAFDVTFDVALPANVTVVVKGCVNLKVEGTEVIALPLDKMTFESGASITIDSSCTLTVPAGVTVNATGDIAVTLTNNGTFNVVSGTSTVTAVGDQSVKGTVNIAKGATLRNLSNDAIAYNDGTTVNVRGTLDMGNTRWTVGGSSVINLYGGCTVNGAGDNNGTDGVFDLFRTGKVLNVLAGESGDSTTVTLSRIRARAGNDNAQADITIADGMTLVIENGMTDAGAANYVAKFGAGVLVVKNTLSADNLVIRAGTLELATGESDTVTVSTVITGAAAVSGTGTISMTGATIDLGSKGGVANKFVATSGESTLKWAGNQAGSFCNNDSRENPVVTVNRGATLTIGGKDFSGWNGDITEHGWFINNGTIVFAAGTGTRFFRDHIVMGDGAIMRIDHGDKNLLLYGGATVATERSSQLMLPSGRATIEAGAAGNNAAIYIGNDSEGGYGGKGAGISVGADATLTISVPIKSRDQGDPLTKFGAGTLMLEGDCSGYHGTFTLADGTLKSVTALTVTTDAEGREVHTETMTEGENTVYTYTLESVSTWPEIWTAEVPDEITAKFDAWRAAYADVVLTTADEKAFLLNIAPTGEEPALAVTEIGFDAEGRVVLTTGDVNLAEANGIVYLYTGDDVTNLVTVRALTAEELEANAVKVAPDPNASAGFYKLGVGYAVPQGASAE